MITIGLTGGICSGKSNVGKVLRELGARVIDADVVGHSVYAVGKPAYHQTIERFGNDIVNPIDHSIDRRKLGALVFGDALAMRK
jgi:dephospho-CoA kinase